MSHSAFANDPLRRMLAGLGNCESVVPQEGPLEQLCAIGANYGWDQLERTIGPKAFSRSSTKAQRNLRQSLARTLEWITRPCFELEWTSYTLALEALRLHSQNEQVTVKHFLGAKPTERLFSLFEKFPALAGLWSVAIGQWRNHAVEILARAAEDERAIARAFLGTSSCGRIKDLRPGLSDRHFGGRSVTLVEFERGRVIYKPRPAAGEAAWAALLRRMNEQGFQPELKPAPVLRRQHYHWMGYVEAAACDDAAAIRRFYQRLGGLIAAAYLLRAVDCHRENLIASGEHPVLVDVDALWHVEPGTRKESAADVLYRTGFFANSDPTSLQSRSSVLGKEGATADHARQIIAGFEEGWRCLVGTPKRRAAFLRFTRRVRSRERRWIYLATEKYGAIIRASLQPAALTSTAARHELIRRFCARHSVSSAISAAEIKALERLDIPYFVRRTKQRTGSVTSSPPPELLGAIAEALQWG